MVRALYNEEGSDLAYRSSSRTTGTVDDLKSAWELPPAFPVRSERSRDRTASTTPLRDIVLEIFAMRRHSTKFWWSNFVLKFDHHNEIVFFLSRLEIFPRESSITHRPLFCPSLLPVPAPGSNRESRAVLMGKAVCWSKTVIMLLKYWSTKIVCHPY
jgi:hypothetical protein